MSKAILVLDEMPEKCEECPLRLPDRDGGASVCYPMRQILLLRVGTVKPDWCPLREMPEYRRINLHDGAYFTERKRGFNDCLRAIEGSGKNV